MKILLLGLIEYNLYPLCFTKMLLSTLATVSGNKDWVELGVIYGNYTSSHQPNLDKAMDNMATNAKCKYQHLGGIINIRFEITFNSEWMVTAYGTAIRIFK